jgi:glycosyltransferase 2 family protein
MSAKRLQNFFRLAFGLSVLAWIAWQLELAKLLAIARAGEPRHFALGCGFLVVAMLGLQWTRLHLLIKSYQPGLAMSLKIFFVGALFNNFLPSNLGGDAMRLIYLQGLRAQSWATPFTLLLVYRLSSFVMLLLGGFVYIALEHARLVQLLRAQQLWVEPRGSTWLAAMGGGLGLLAIAFALRERLSARVKRRAAEFARACQAALQLLSRRDLCWLFVQTGLFHLCRMLSFYFLVRYGGQSIALWDLVFVISATAVMAVLPVTVAGLGVLEASITGLLVMYGVELSSAGAVAFVNRAVLLLTAAIGGIIYLRSGDAGPARAAKSTATSA